MILANRVETQKRLGLASAFLQGLEIPAIYPNPEAIASAADMLRTHPALEAASIDAIVVNIAALAQAQHVAVSMDDSVHDWDMMFRAVKARLTSAVGQVLEATPGLEPQAATVLVQTIVLECVMALSQLHTALKQERCQRDQLELEATDAKALLAQGIASQDLSGAAIDGFVT